MDSLFLCVRLALVMNSLLCASLVIHTCMCIPYVELNYNSLGYMLVCACITWDMVPPTVVLSSLLIVSPRNLLHLSPSLHWKKVGTTLLLLVHVHSMQFVYCYCGQVGPMTVEKIPCKMCVRGRIPSEIRMQESRKDNKRTEMRIHQAEWYGGVHRNYCCCGQVGPMTVKRNTM